jgi:hypothetical protein
MLKHYSSYRNGEDGTLYNYDYWLKNAWDMLERSPRISQRDKELVRAFVDHLKVRALGTGRLAKHVQKLKVMLEILGVQVETATRADVESWSLRWRISTFAPSPSSTTPLHPEAVLQVREARERGQGDPLPGGGGVDQEDAHEPGGACEVLGRDSGDEKRHPGHEEAAERISLTSLS